eukprot:6461535-Amphidinium_carterae.3
MKRHVTLHGTEDHTRSYSRLGTCMMWLREHRSCRECEECFSRHDAAVDVCCPGCRNGGLVDRKKNSRI